MGLWANHSLPLSFLFSEMKEVDWPLSQAYSAMDMPEAESNVTPKKLSI